MTTTNFPCPPSKNCLKATATNIIFQVVSITTETAETSYNVTDLSPFTVYSFKVTTVQYSTVQYSTMLSSIRVPPAPGAEQDAAWTPLHPDVMSAPELETALASLRTRVAEVSLHMIIV